MFRNFVILLALFSLLEPTNASAMTVKPGAEVIYKENFSLLRGTRFGLLINSTAMVGNLHLLHLLKAAGIPPAVIFTPEHGLKGKAEDGVQLADSSEGGVPVKSLYGLTRKPQQQDLKGLDLLVFDMQDIGVRFYTYISTMGLAMQAAAEAGIPFVVLDRPNPLGGSYVAGFTRKELSPSFTSPYPIPTVHGMTIGELALMIKGLSWLPGLDKLDLRIVKMEGWQRWMRWPDTGLSWTPTSPNIADFSASLIYPGTGLLEATSASEGRGTNEPFLLAGWPGIDHVSLAVRLNSFGFPGVAFEPAQFKPVCMPGKASKPKCMNKAVNGIRICITDYRSVQPVEVGIAVVSALYWAIPPAETKHFFREGFDDMAGTVQLRRAIVKGTPLMEIIKMWQNDSLGFRKLREPYLLYGDK